MDVRLEAVDKILSTFPDIGEDPEREAAFAIEAIDWYDPTTLHWAAACLVARAAELEAE